MPVAVDRSGIERGPAPIAGSIRVTVCLILAGLFAFRLLFGLSSEFFFEDETQIYLLGLRHYATGHWPFFGPDVVWTKSEIPGALQALLVGVPLTLAPIPEAPFVLLNLLSFGALSALAWYTCEHLPRSPRWLIWGWFLTIPWTLQFSTHVINPSYVLPAAIVFFLGFFEAVPALSLRRIPPPVAHALMGAAFVWIMQIHMSWPLLGPFLLFAWLSRRADGLAALAVNAASCAAGALVPALTLIPTLLRYGPHEGTGGVLRNIHPHWVSPAVIVTTLARFFSFASLEISRFIGTDGAKRLEFFQRHMWLVPFALVVWLAGVVQPLWMLVDACRPSRQWPPALPRTQWRALRRIVVGAVLLVYVSYWFVLEPPQAHAFYVLAPIALVFAAYWWSFVDSPRARTMAALVLAINVCFHAGLAWAQAPELSLYKRRAIVAAAIRLKQPEMFAHRREFAIDGGPATLDGRARPYDPRQDFEVIAAQYRPGPRRSLHWTITIHNRSQVVAYRDPLYFTTYLDERDRVVEERHERIKDIFQPGVTQTIELNDGFAGPPFAKARLRIVAAEALLPAPPE
jgi:hypothetical protein